MYGGVEDQGPEYGEAPDVGRMIEIVCLASSDRERRWVGRSQGLEEACLLLTWSREFMRVCMFHLIENQFAKSYHISTAINLDRGGLASFGDEPFGMQMDSTTPSRRCPVPTFVLSYLQQLSKCRQFIIRT